MSDDEPAAAEESEGIRALREILEERSGERHAVALQDYPDPDAISSALAHKMIAARFGIECDILYAGVISHPENVALVRLIELDLVRCTGETDLSIYQGCAYVDNQGTTSRVTGWMQEAGVPSLVVVDHHEPQEGLEPVLSDLRKVGATATIYCEYLREGLIPLSRSEGAHVRLATALMHGIRSDTGHLIRAGPEDYRAAAFLSEYHDPVMLEQILGIKRSRRVMDVIRKALAAKEVVDNYCLAGVGYLKNEDRDIIPQVADFLLTEENVHTVAVYGVVVKGDRQESVVGSLRSTKITLEPDKFLKETLGADDTGRAYGGGRREAGGFEIPVGFLSGSPDEESEQLKWELIDRTVRSRFLEGIGRQA